MPAIIAYFRVSTATQGESGLGIEAQQNAVASYAASHGASIKASYTEIESGTRSDRPELARAIAHAKRSKAILVVARLDRLSRNVAFLAKVMDSGCEFVACDNPAANRLTLHILAAVAENEAAAISSRTKAALAAAKARGTLLGSDRTGHWDGPCNRRPDVSRHAARVEALRRGNARSAEVRRANARDAYADLKPQILELRKAGRTLAQIAQELNTAGHSTRRGMAWTPVQIHRILAD